MAITFVGSHVGTHAATSAQTVNFSSLLNESGGNTMPATNDIVFVAVENASTVDRGAGTLVPSGYTAAHTADYRNDSNDSNFQVSYKVMGATPDTTVAIPASNATTAGVGYAIYCFRGVDTTTPQDVTTQVTGAINTGIANAPSITPVTAGAWIAAFGGAAVAAGAVFTNPAGMSTTTNHFRSATITSTTNDANIGGALYTAWTSGAYDPAAFGGSTSTNTGSWSAVTVALRPFVAVDHAATGALTGQIGSVAGSAAHIAVHTSTGALTGQLGSVAGTAAHIAHHTTTGALAGQGSTVAGSATRFRAHAATGAITGPGSVLSGSASRFAVHAATGALTGAGAVIDGAADLTAGGGAQPLHGRRTRGRRVRFEDELDVAETVGAETVRPVIIDVITPAKAVAEHRAQAAALLARIATVKRKAGRDAKVAALQAEYDTLAALIAESQEAERAYVARLRDEDEFILLTA